MKTQEPNKELIDISPKDKKYLRLFTKVSETIHPTIKDLDEIVSIVREDFKESENNY